MDYYKMKRALQYWYKCTFISVSPSLYWRVNRGRLKEEAEFAVLPLLSDFNKISVDVGANFGLYTW